MVPQGDHGDLPPKRHKLVCAFQGIDNVGEYVSASFLATWNLKLNFSVSMYFQYEEFGVARIFHSAIHPQMHRVNTTRDIIKKHYQREAKRMRNEGSFCMVRNPSSPCHQHDHDWEQQLFSFAAYDTAPSQAH